MNSNEVRRRWAERSGEYSPKYYAYYGPNETSDAIRRILDRFVDRSAAVLELGCSSGRHLAHLHEHGFENLAGIDVNEEAFDVMEDAYPDLAADGEFYADAIENVVDEFDDDQFGAVYSVETLQHLHSDTEWVFDELSRITDDLLVTAENEAGTAKNGADTAKNGADTAKNGADTAKNGADTAEFGGGDARTGSIDREVSYVDDVPLFYRDWNAIFTNRGFSEIDAESGKRETIRTFRTTSDRTGR